MKRSTVKLELEYREVVNDIDNEDENDYTEKENVVVCRLVKIDEVILDICDKGLGRWFTMLMPRNDQVPIDGVDIVWPI